MQSGVKLTLVERRGNRPFDPGCVVVHHVDGEVGVPVRDDLYRAVALGTLGTRGTRAVKTPFKYHNIKQIHPSQGLCKLWKYRRVFLTFIISGSASVSPVRRFLVFWNFLRLNLFSTEIGMSENLILLCKSDSCRQTKWYWMLITIDTFIQRDTDLQHGVQDRDGHD